MNEVLPARIMICGNIRTWNDLLRNKTYSHFLWFIYWQGNYGGVVSPVSFYPWCDVFCNISMIKRLLQVLYHVSPKTLWTIVDVKIYYVIRNVFKIYATSIFIAISLNKMNLILIHTAWYFKECRKAFLFIVCSINLKKEKMSFHSIYVRLWTLPSNF